MLHSIHSRPLTRINTMEFSLGCYCYLAGLRGCHASFDDRPSGS